MGDFGMGTTSLWPALASSLAKDDLTAALLRAEPRIAAWQQTEMLDDSVRAWLEPLYAPLAGWAAQRCRNKLGPFLLGLAGAQGTGKSTLAGLLAILLADGFGLRSVALSLDDFYLTHAERERLACQVHPLLRTRGVPGTHDTELLSHTLTKLCTARAGERVTYPRFDKASDDRVPRALWSVAQGPIDLVVLEGWCIGARAEPAAELAAPVNALERDEDPDGRFRGYVNAALEGPYRALFAQLDALVFLAVPDPQSVLCWRAKQERMLASRAQAGSHGVMSAEQLARFVQHFERITRRMLAEIPGQADVVLQLGRDHTCETVSVKS